MLNDPLYTIGYIKNYHFFSDGHIFFDVHELINFYEKTTKFYDTVEITFVFKDHSIYMPINEFIRPYKLKLL